MKKVAVIGGSGFIGSHLTSAIKTTGRSVVAFSRRGNAVNCVPADYADIDALARALEGVNSIAHVAGLAHVSSKSLLDAESAYYSANVHAAVNVAKAAVLAGVERFILLSSAGVFGSHSPPEGFNDSSAPQPYDLYTKSKLEAEHRVQEIVSSRMELVILRPPMVYGPNAPGSFRGLHLWVEKGLPLPFGSIFARRSFVGIRNLCSAFIAAETSRSTQDLPMIVADRESVSVAEFARAIARANGRRATVLPVPRWALKYGLTVLGLEEEYRRIALPFELHPSRISSIIGWEAPYTLADELRWVNRT
jgi:nucleoside-diphosphate-sugar epimerase